MVECFVCNDPYDLFPWRSVRSVRVEVKVMSRSTEVCTTSNTTVPMKLQLDIVRLCSIIFQSTFHAISMLFYFGIKAIDEIQVQEVALALHSTCFLTPKKVFRVSN